MSSSDERSPKRQRRSYSPASPPTAVETKAVVHPLPETPPPSVHMSPSWQPHTMSSNHAGSVSGSTTFPTPPSTAGFQIQNTMERGQGGSEGGESSQQTPAAEIEQLRDQDGDAEMPDRQDDERLAVVGTASDAEHRKTNHERQDGGDTLLQGSVPSIPSLYLLSTQPIAPSRPHPSQNLVSLYSLERIQASVARKDVAGNKINKLRKSYENKVKNFGLEGRSKAVPGNAALQGLLDPDWDVELQPGVTQWQAKNADMDLEGPSTTDVLAKLDAAFAMLPGHLPPKEHEYWKGILGLDDVVNKPTPGTNPVKPAPVSGLLAKSTAGLAPRSSAPTSPRQLSRPQREGKKRKYDESSYSGYQEGYEDDSVDETGSRRGSASGVKRQKTQQRKEFSAASSPPFSSGNGGMVGVRTS